MKKFLSILLVAVAVLSVAAPAMADVELRLRTGATWRGDVGDMVRVVYTERGVEIEQMGEVTFVSTSPAYITIKTDIAGKLREKTIFGADIRKLEGAEKKDEADPGRGGTDKPDRFRPESRRAAPGSALGAGAGAADVPRDDLGRPIGVFVLPLEGGVGQEFRHDEIVKLTEYIDENYGPGQTIVLYINSNGGLVIESFDIAEAIFEARKRHRVVAWVDKAISAGCMTAMSCYEIYFRSAATAGSVTTVQGTRSVQTDLERIVEEFVEVAEKSGYSEHIARSMKLNRFVCSYDKDPETGEITFYGDLRGEFKLSTDSQNLAFNSNNALHSGFSKGTADTGPELAKLLGMPKWVEIDDYGRRLAKSWQDEYKRVQEQFADIQYELQNKNQFTGDQLVVMNTQLQAMKKIVRMYDRYPRLTWLTFGGQSPEQGKEAWEQQVEELQRQIAMMRRR
jgi:ATP-dependent protease ClpP protease subunit